jgi:cell wall-associated NlpC family hydrolase
MIDVSEFLDAVFKHNGRGPNAYDCWGLCMAVYRKLGIELPDYRPECNAYVIESVILQNAESSLFTKLEKPEVPSLALLKVRPKAITHVGAMITAKTFLQILENSRVSIGHIDAPPWQNRLRGFYRFNG